jgi:type IX secretion system PorP/SprF family membrane protein
VKSIVGCTETCLINFRLINKDQIKLRGLTLLFVVATSLVTGGYKIGFATDPLFSQFYANPLYLNPAFSGSQRCTRMILNYRNQPYPGFGTFSTYSFSIDNYFESLSGGLGINVLHDDQGGLLSNTRVGISYAFHGRLSRDWFINFGVQASYVNYRLNWNDLIFPDQYSPFQSTLPVSNELQPDRLSSHTADFAAGILIYKVTCLLEPAYLILANPKLSFLSSKSYQLNIQFILVTIFCFFRAEEDICHQSR